MYSGSKKMIRKRRNNIFLYLQNFSNQNFSSKKNFGVHRPSRADIKVRSGAVQKINRKKNHKIKNYEILVVQGHLQPPLTETSTSLATVTTDTRASKTMLKIWYFLVSTDTRFKSQNIHTFKLKNLFQKKSYILSAFHKHSNNLIL